MQQKYQDFSYIPSGKDKPARGKLTLADDHLKFSSKDGVLFEIALKDIQSANLDRFLTIYVDGQRYIFSPFGPRIKHGMLAHTFALLGDFLVPSPGAGSFERQLVKDRNDKVVLQEWRTLFTQQNIPSGKRPSTYYNYLLWIVLAVVATAILAATFIASH